MRVQAAEGLAQPLAAAQGVDLNVIDHAPLAADDPTGTGLFYLVMVCTIVGYLTITVLSQVAPRMRLRQQLGVLGVMSVVGVLAAYLVSAIFVGFYGASFAASLALLAVVIAYTIVVGLVSILVNRVFGKAAIMVVMVLMIFVNFPSAGGAFPADFLPGFWSALSHFWIGAGAVDETERHAPGLDPAILDALEATYPMLRGTIRDGVTKERRAFIRFFACGEDLSHEPADAAVPDEVRQGKELFRIIGAMAGG